MGQLQGLLKDVSLVDLATSPGHDIIGDYGHGLESLSNEQSNQETNLLEEANAENLSFQNVASETSATSQAFETTRSSRRDSLSQEQVSVRYIYIKKF